MIIPYTIMVHHKCLSKRGYTIDKGLITPAEEKEIIKDLTVTTTVLPAYQAFQKPQVYKIYYHSNTALYVPRAYGIARFGTPDTISIPRGVEISCKCHFGPLPHQADAIQKLDEVFDPEKQIGDGGVLSLPCGYGKTYCAIYTACRVGRSTLIIVPTEALMDQWIDAIRQFTNGTVGTIQRDKIDTDHDFVVAMLHSISMKDYPPGTFDRFGLTVYDECHHISSQTFCKALLKVPSRFMLGLSATPERRDGLSHVFYKFIGPLLHKERRAGTNQVVIKKVLCSSSHPAYDTLTMSNGTKNTSGMTTAISKFDERNRVILHCLKHMAKQGRKVLLLSSRREHLHYIKCLLDKEGIKCPETGRYITYGFYYGKKGTNRALHKKVLAESAKCDIILGIDAIAKEGLDIPDLNCLVFATPPGLDVEQPVGRILRKFHKDFNPTVIDIIDKTGNYQKHSAERDSWYKTENYLIQELRFTLTDDDSDVSDMWSDILTDYLQRVRVELQPKGKIKVNIKAPSMDLCLLECTRKKPVQKPREEPDLDVCHI